MLAGRQSQQLLDMATASTGSSGRALQTPQSKKFEFIVDTGTQRSTRQDKALRRSVRSNASRSRTKKQPRMLPSWILQSDGHVANVGADYVSIPRQIGPDLLFANLPIEIRPYMIGDVANALGPMRDALYPSEICLQVDSSSSSWVTNLLVDILYLRCTIFSVEAFLDSCFQREQSILTQFHFLNTMRLLQGRLNDPFGAEAFSDATIMVVIVLGQTAELVGDRHAADAHMEGLRKMVHMRGGFDSLQSQNPRLPAKLCRLDLSLALRFGCEPSFFRESMSWDPFVSKLAPGKRETLPEDKTSIFLSKEDKNLSAIWKDLQEFCRLCNLASQTPYKLAPNTFSEILISALYRLLSISHVRDSLHLEVFRLGMITMASQVFFQWRGIRQRQHDLDGRFRATLLQIQHTHSDIPDVGVLWLLFMASSSVSELPGSDDLAEWTRLTMAKLNLKAWEEARDVLRPVMWIDFICSPQISRLFDNISNV